MGLGGSDLTRSQAPGCPNGWLLPEAGCVVDGRYQITRQIAAGGMGTVFEAVQLNIGRRCAIKFLRAELATGALSTARFRREAHLLGKLEHEHLSVVLDAGTYLGQVPYLVMEYLEGRTLRELISERGHLSLELTLDILLQTCDGMAFVHAHQIVHRDLKPSNVMVVERSLGGQWVKILDFGIARDPSLDAHLTPSGAELGTAHYMSPEQIMGAKQVGPASDVYALGAMAYEMLTGSRPHPGESYNAVIFRRLTTHVRPLSELMPSCPRDVVALVERCLANDPTQRFVDAGELAGPLSALVAAHSSRSSFGAASAVRERASWQRRPGQLERGAWALIGALLGAAVVAGVSALRPLEPAPDGSAPGERPRMAGQRGGSEPDALVDRTEKPSVVEPLPTADVTLTEALGPAERARPHGVTAGASQRPVSKPSPVRRNASEVSKPSRDEGVPFILAQPTPVPAEPGSASAAVVTPSLVLPEPAAAGSPRLAPTASESFPFVTSNPYGEP